MMARPVKENGKTGGIGKDRTKRIERIDERYWKVVKTETGSEWI